MTETSSNYSQVIQYMPNKSDSYYIASGFFTEKQIAVVDAIEESLRGLNQKFFSPRSESIKFFAEKDPEIKSMMTKLIFNNNLDCMRSANKYIVNLMDEDQGTLFEYGYIVGRMNGSYKLPSALSKNIKVMHDKTGLEKLILTSIKDEGFLDTSFSNKGKDFNYVNELLNKYVHIKNSFDSGKLGIFSIDDRDPINMFLVGFFFAQEIPVITYSKQGYGSNVMLVHSTYHCENEPELVSLLENLNSRPFTNSNSAYSDLFLNKQTWNKVID